MPDEQSLRTAIRNTGSLVIAFSGGLDSTVLARLASEELGNNVIAVTVDSETFPREELQACKNLAVEIGIRSEIIKRSDLKDPRFTKNPIDRCYYCRSGLAEVLRTVADDNGIDIIADGANSDDLSDYRPGLKAFEEAGIWHPFIEHGFDKNGVRILARKLELSIKEKPSMACLASRISYHDEITEKKLRQIENAENYIRDLNFSQVRVRLLKDNVARIEVIPSELDILLDPEIRDKIVDKLKDLGFKYVTVDLEGYRTGSMNISIEDDIKKDSKSE